jgi:hypothetical protein
MNHLELYQHVLDSDRILDDSATQPAKKAAQDHVTNADKALIAQATSGQGSGKSAKSGFAVADVEVKGGIGIVIHAITERVPPGETIKGFVGYRTLYHALAEANQGKMVTVVLSVSDGRFRVFDTDQKKHDIAAETVVSISPREPPSGGLFFLSARPINLVAPKEKGAWSNLVQLASSDQDYVSLIRLGTGLEQNEVNVAASPRDWMPRLLNFQLAFEDGANGQTRTRLRNPMNPDQFLDIAVSLRSFVETKTGPLPFVVKAISKVGVFSYSPVAMMETIVHEATHEALEIRALELIRFWRETKSDNFQSWLLKQKSITGQIITIEENQHASERANGGMGELPTTGTLARIEAFMSCYHNPEFPIDKSGNLISSINFKQLGDMHEVWPPVSADLKVKLLKRLSSYYGGLDNTHQSFLKEYLNNYISANPDTADFHKRLLANLP